MARPRDEEKRQAVLDAAAKAFLERGYEGTTVDLVADGAGAARRTVYHQFGSKDGLFAAVVEHLWSGLRFEAPPGGLADGDVRGRLSEIARQIVEYWRSPVARDFLRLVIVEGPRFPALLDGYYRKGKLPVFTALSERLRDFSRAGLLVADVAEDPALAAQQLIGLLNESLLWPRLLGAPAPTDADRRHFESAAVDMFMARYGVDA